MKNRKVDKNLVAMVQTEERAKTFRVDYPVAEELQAKMITEVFSDFATFVYEEFYHEETLLVLKEFVEESNPHVLKKQSLLDNLFWWQIMYQSAQNTLSCVDEYLTMNHFSFMTRPFMTSWLRKCDKSVPKFYFIAHKYNDRHFLAIDILTEELLEVFICHSNAISPERGEIVAGTLLPLGGGLYFPIVDFYRFDYEAREAIGSCFHHHYDKYSKNSSPHESFLQVLSVMLQIEHKISMDTGTMSR
jgi:thiol-disulfide isomerase/thioredoxin